MVTFRDLSPVDERRLLPLGRKYLKPLSVRPTEQEPQFSPLSGVKALLFDLYGTLMISDSGDIGHTRESDRLPLEDLFREAGIDAASLSSWEGSLSTRLKCEIEKKHDELRRQGNVHPEVDILSLWSSLFAAFYREGKLRSLPSLFQISHFSFIFELSSNAVWAMPFAREFLATLRDRGLPFGIVSNAQFYTPITMELLFGDALETLGFSLSYSSWSYKEGLAKPSRDLMRPAVAALREERGILPEEILFLGNDMLNDIWTASKMGLRTVLFAGDARSLRWRHMEPRCCGLRPTAIVTSWEQGEGFLPR